MRNAARHFLPFCRKPRVIFLTWILVSFTFLSSVRAIEQKRQKKPSAEETIDYFKNWLEKDVVYIITPEERDVFEKLMTEDEKTRFIEQFWKRRDSNTATSLNEFTEEHYRRIAYANDHFVSGIEGWATDRGRTYITFGPPTSIDSRPSGGHYGRNLSEGGGYTETYPFERWYYNHMPGIGSGIELEFVDASLSGEYRLALSDAEKDALLYIEGAGETLYERANLGRRSGRILAHLMGRTVGLTEYSPGYTGRNNPFMRMERYFAVKRPPELEFHDLAVLVTTNVSYTNPLPFDQLLDTFRVTSEQVLVPVTLKVPQRELQYKKVENTYRASAQIYAKVETIGREVVYEFEDVLTSVLRAEPSTLARAFAVYQKKLPLRPGKFKLSVVLKDEASGRVGIRVSLLVVPGYPDGKLKASTLVLTKTVTTAGAENLVDPFVTLGGVKIYPEDSFWQGDKIAYYLEIYGAGFDQATEQPDIQLAYRLLQFGEGDPQVAMRMSEPAKLLRGDSVILLGFFPGDLSAGRFRVELQALDQISSQTLSMSREFVLQ